MFYTEKLMELFKKNKYLKNLKNNTNFIPRQTISIKINNIEYYISLICDNRFQVQVVLLDTNNNIIHKLLEIDNDRASIVKLKDKLYIFTEEKSYIYDINNLNASPITSFIGNLDIQGICSNKNNIYAYSIARDKIIKYDQNLIPIQEYENPYSKDNIRVSLKLTCNEETFFSIPIMIPKEEQYILMKRFLEHCVGHEIAKLNDQINSCSFNNDENTLYISMYNIIWIIKDGIEFSYLHFKDKAITTTFYDNDIKQLIINFGDINGKQLCGSILKLSDKEISEKSISITDKISYPFQYSENTNINTNRLLNNEYNQDSNKRR